MTIDSAPLFIDQMMRLFRASDLRETEDSPGTRMVRLVQQTYRHIVANDFDGLTHLLTDDFEMEILGPASIPISGLWRGKDAVRQALSSNFSLLQDQVPDLIGVNRYRDAILVMGRETGRVRATQKPYQVHWVQWFTFRDDQLCRMLEIFDDQQIGQAFIAGSA